MYLQISDTIAYSTQNPIVKLICCKSLQITSESNFSSHWNQISLHKGIKFLFTKESNFSSQRNQISLHKGIKFLFTKESNFSSQRNQISLHKVIKFHLQEKVANGSYCKKHSSSTWYSCSTVQYSTVQYSTVQYSTVFISFSAHSVFLTAEKLARKCYV